MTINLRKYYFTRSGLLVDLHCLEPRAQFLLAVKGRIKYRDKENRRRANYASWTRKGLYSLKTRLKGDLGHHLDLIEVSREEWERCRDSQGL